MRSIWARSFVASLALLTAVAIGLSCVGSARAAVDSVARGLAVYAIKHPGGSPTGSAGGDLSGSYPDPTVQKFNGSPPAFAGACGANASGSSLNITYTVTDQHYSLVSNAIQASDCGGTIDINSSTDLTPTIAEAGTGGFTEWSFYRVCNEGTHSQTITPGGGTIGGVGNTTYSLAAGTTQTPSCVKLTSDGVSNYDVTDATGGGGGSGPALSGDNAWTGNETHTGIEDYSTTTSPGTGVAGHLYVLGAAGLDGSWVLSAPAGAAAIQTDSQGMDLLGGEIKLYNPYGATCQFFGGNWTCTGNINAGGGYLQTSGFTVSGLGAATTKGLMTFVTDATACTVGSTPTGGASTFCPVISTGSAWIAF